MTIQHILQAISDSEDGRMHFNNRIDLHCFLYINTWYPLRAIVNHASALANENEEYTKDGALYELSRLLPYVKIKQVTVENNELVSLTSAEKLSEIAALSDMIKQLTC